MVPDILKEYFTFIFRGQWSLYTADLWRWNWHIPSQSTDAT